MNEILLGVKINCSKYKMDNNIILRTNKKEMIEESQDDDNDNIKN